MNYYRRRMIHDGDTIGLCEPYVSDDGENAYVVDQGRIMGFVIDGVEESVDEEEGFHLLAQAVAKNYDDMIKDGLDDEDIVMKYLVGARCCDCPWFEECEYLNEDPEWDYMKDFFDLCQNDLEEYGIEVIDSWSSYDSRYNFYRDTLYSDKEGMYYVYSESRYGNTSTRMNKEEAMEWAERNLDVEDYIEIFGDPEE